MSDQGVIRTGSYEDRFQRLMAQYFELITSCVPLDVIKRLTYELLDEYSVVVTKRLEGTLVSTDESLPLSPQDLGQLIPALRNRARAARENQRRKGVDRSQDIAYTERLLARACDMLASYGPAEPGDVLWPVVDRR